MGDISNSLQPLCHCPERELVLGTKPYVCQVCELYNQTTIKIAEVFQDSKLKAEKVIKEKELEALELAEIKDDDDIDLSVEEFEEDEEITERFEKREPVKSIEEAEDFIEAECPFCGELFENLGSHLKTCEFAPEDVDIKEYLPSRPKRKKKKKEPSTTTEKKEQNKKPCPYCKKDYARLGRHLPHCEARPDDPDEEKEKLYSEGKIDVSKFNQD
ncbi:MAG: hypothetical protein KGD57_05045 [Candidatus Lokiarchaeota archaeon]|nr:hypothetical protein [Candidatus Lokiarchaeota archaeon]